MERALRAIAEKYHLRRNDPNTPKLGIREQLKEFGDLLIHQHQEDTDGTFDNNEMCEYATSVQGFFLPSILLSFLMFCPVLKAEKQFMEAAKTNNVEFMRVVSRGLNVNAKNMVCTALHKHMWPVPFCKSRE